MNHYRMINIIMRKSMLFLLLAVSFAFAMLHISSYTLTNLYYRFLIIY
jgi:hypothetical protein